MSGEAYTPEAIEPVWHLGCTGGRLSAFNDGICNGCGATAESVMGYRVKDRLMVAVKMMPEPDGSTWRIAHWGYHIVGDVFTIDLGWSSGTYRVVGFIANDGTQVSA